MNENYKKLIEQMKQQMEDFKEEERQSKMDKIEQMFRKKEAEHKKRMEKRKVKGKQKVNRHKLLYMYTSQRIKQCRDMEEVLEHFEKLNAKLKEKM